MKKYIATLLVGISSLSFAFAQVSANISETPVECTALSYGMTLGSKDVKTNGEVTLLQTYLAKTSYLSVDPTGFYGKLTFAAVKAFQKDNGIAIQGNVGPNTRARIKAISCETTARTSSYTPVSTVTTTDTDTTFQTSANTVTNNVTVINANTAKTPITCYGGMILVNGVCKIQTTSFTCPNGTVVQVPNNISFYTPLTSYCLSTYKNVDTETTGTTVTPNQTVFTPIVTPTYCGVDRTLVNGICVEKYVIYTCSNGREVEIPQTTPTSEYIRYCPGQTGTMAAAITGTLKISLPGASPYVTTVGITKNQAITSCSQNAQNRVVNGATVIPSCLWEGVELNPAKVTQVTVTPVTVVATTTATTTTSAASSTPALSCVINDVYYNLVSGYNDNDLFIKVTGTPSYLLANADYTIKGQGLDFGTNLHFRQSQEINGMKILKATQFVSTNVGAYLVQRKKDIKVVVDGQNICEMPAGATN